MNLLFVNDTKVYHDSASGEYFHQTLNLKFWENRYLTVFDKVDVACRVIDMPDNIQGKIAKASG